MSLGEYLALKGMSDRTAEKSAQWGAAQFVADNQIKKEEMGGVCSAHMGEMINTYRILVRKTEQKASPRRHKHRWEDSLQINLR
jgi:hypothetical protein